MKGIFSILCFLSLFTLNATVNPNSTEEEVIVNYLTNPSDTGQTLAQQVIDQAHSIQIHYTHEAAIEGEQESTVLAESLLASNVTPISRHMPDGRRLPEIFVSFCKLSRNAQGLDSHGWLTQMQRPMDEGYKIKTIRVVLTPSSKVIEESYQRAIAAAESLSEELESLTNIYPQLKSYSDDCVQLGEETSDFWPSYPSIWYQQDIAKFNRSGPVKTSKDWCYLGFSIRTIDDNLFQGPTQGRTYEYQALQAVWHVQSANPELEKVFNECVINSLLQLDEYEARLQTADQ